MIHAAPNTPTVTMMTSRAIAGHGGMMVFMLMIYIANASKKAGAAHFADAFSHPFSSM
jgi:hypothetical protein